jgi:hypothetical protein
MGKVASTAIVSSVQQYGLKASQPHFLTMESFITLLKKFGDPEMTHFAATNLLGQIQNNVIIHTKIQKQKKYQYRDDKEAPLLKIITLAREPIGWYLSNLSQNYPEYEKDIEDWLKCSGISGSEEISSDKQRALIEFVNEVIRFFEKNVAETEENIFEVSDQRVRQTEGNIIRKLAARLNRVIHSLGRLVRRPEGNMIQKLAACLDKDRVDYTQASEILVKHCFMLIRPINWFREHFDPVIGTRFEKMPFDKDLGYSHFTKNGMDILVIRFEDLKEIGPKVIGDFLDIQDFKMEKQNISENKEVGAMISRSMKHLDFSEAVLDKIYSSDYCSKFYTQKHITEFKNRYL